MIKNKLLSIILVLALSLSVVIGTGLVTFAADSEPTAGYQSTAAKLTENIKLQVKFNASACTFATVKVGDKDAVDVTNKVTLSDGVVIVPVELAVKDLDKALVVTLNDGTATYTKNTLEDGTDVFTAKAYLAGLAGGDYAELAAALESYSDVAKIYFSSDKSTLTAPESAPAASKTYAVSVTKLPEGLVHKSASLILESETTIRHYFEGDITGYTFKLGEETLTPVANGNRWYVDIDEITPKDLDTPYTISVQNSTMAEPYTCTYAALDYVARAFEPNSDATDARKAISAELYTYWAEAEMFKSITYVSNGAAMPAEDTYDTMFKTGKPTVSLPGYQIDFTKVSTVNMESKILNWYFDEELTEYASPAAVAAVTDDVTLYAGVHTSVQSTNNLSTANGTGYVKFSDAIVAGGGAITFSFAANPADTSAADRTAGTPIFIHRGDTNSSSPHALCLLNVKGDNIYPYDYGNGAETVAAEAIGSYSNGDKIDVVLQFALNGDYFKVLPADMQSGAGTVSGNPVARVSYYVNGEYKYSTLAANSYFTIVSGTSVPITSFDQTADSANKMWFIPNTSNGIGYSFSNGVFNSVRSRHNISIYPGSVYSTPVVMGAE